MKYQEEELANEEEHRTIQKPSSYKLAHQMKEKLRTTHKIQANPLLHVCLIYQ